MPKSIEERVKQLQETIAQLVDDIKQGNFGKEELQQKNDELQALLTELTQTIQQEHQERELRMETVLSTVPVHHLEIEKKFTLTTNALKQVNEQYQVLIAKQYEQIDKLSRIVDRAETINALKENGFFAQDTTSTQEIQDNNHKAQP